MRLLEERSTEPNVHYIVKHSPDAWFAQCQPIIDRHSVNQLMSKA